MTEEALTAVETIHKHQADFGHFGDHWECGYRYSRPLSSWSTLHGALGLAYNASLGALTLRPAILPTEGKPFRTPLCLPDCLGSVEFTESGCTIRITEGNLSLGCVYLPSGEWKTISLNGNEVQSTFHHTAKGPLMRFTPRITLPEGSALILARVEKA